VGIRSGPEYVESLRDGRHLHIDGNLVTDVTQYAPFQGIIGTLASLYDAQQDPRYRDLLTYTEQGSAERVARAYQRAETWADMQLRMRSDYIRTDMTYGLIGRLNDFMSAWLTDCVAAFRFAGQTRALERSQWYHDHARRNDLCITHALIDPQSDRSKDGAPDETVRIVDRRHDGVVVSGARLLSTLAPVANEVYVGPFGPRRPGEEDKALIFSLPMATEGLKILCRESYDKGRSTVDRPLSSRFDEGDALLIFDRVFVPDQRLIVGGDIDAYNSCVPNMPGYFLLQAVARSAAKLRFLLGLARVGAKATGRDKSPRHLEMIGEIVTFVNIAEGLHQGAAHEVLARVEAQGRGEAIARGEIGQPAIQPSVANSAIVTFFPMAMQKSLETVRVMVGSGALTFTEADYHHPDLTGLLDRLIVSPSMSGFQRMEVMKLIWDITGEQFGSRQALYERYYSGDPIKNNQIFATMPKSQESEEMVLRLLALQVTAPEAIAAERTGQWP
jgi:4-hydroxyphenylacetate 3-monooxygenase/anthranilate 3-monooxygenase (FAD)/4-hydroxyphenylacetate 3-monooxygenase